MARNSRASVAFCYDFDGTLAPGNMQEHGFLPDVGIDKDDFWKRVTGLAKEHRADNILVYMREMLRAADQANRSIRREQIEEHGKAVELFSGVVDWFERVNNRGKLLGLGVEHYIISSGLREMIEGTKIKKKFKEIYASSFIYDGSGVAVWPAMALNYTTKTQYLFRINKGTLDVWDHSKINKFTPRHQRPVPFSRMIFIGDGETDVPCMRLLVEQRGYAIAVYHPKKRGARKPATALLEQERANFVAPADYSEGSELDKIADRILNEIAARLELDKLGRPAAIKP